MDEDDYLPLSGIQHFAFCRRQWALIHIEQQWQENSLTAEGRILHETTHDENVRAKRGDTLIVHALKISSRNLGLAGECDTVEFHASPDGVPIQGQTGTWLPYPVEYKRGKPKEHDADRLQLCAQAICLEEMLCCEILTGALFYEEIRRRETVDFTDEMRQSVRAAAKEMHELFSRQYTPRVKPGSFCQSCSLKDVCLPKLGAPRSTAAYLQEHLEETT